MIVTRFRLCALASMNAYDAAFDGTIPRQPSLVRKIRVLSLILPPAARRRESSRQVATTVRCSSRVPLRRSRCRRETTVEITRVHRTKGRMNTKQVCPRYIYVPAVVPAKLPGEPTAHFQITDQIQIRNVVNCIPVHCPNSVPLSRNQYPVLRTADLPITLQRPVLSILEFPT